MAPDDIEKYRYDFEIIRETANQVMKDFNLSGFEITFSGNELLAYEELKNQIAPILMDLFRNHSGQFQNLLYRVDVNEKQLNEAIQLNDPDSLPESLAALILQREFKKVLTRRFYS